MSAIRGLEASFRRHLLGAEGVVPGDGVVVALSGGADSVVLLHLLRFTPGLPAIRLTAAHVDHAMRVDSGDDARWVAGLCRAWEVPLSMHRLDPAPRDEAAARRRRYAWLEKVRQEASARWVVTAHHADDQAETVLFRAVRGTGVTGLRGILERRPPGVWRPLLPFSRADLRAYARRHHLSWREDPTNLLARPRNVLRHTVLPALDAGVAPGASRALARLAARVAGDEAAWESVEADLLGTADLRAEPEAVSLDREAFLRLHPAVRGRLLRTLARRLGGALGEAGTRRAEEFTISGDSGSRVEFGGGLVLRRDLGRLRLTRSGPGWAEGAPVVVPSDASEGAGQLSLGGVLYDVRWRVRSPERPGWESFARGAVAFPLCVRGWRPGDAVALPYGSKKLKKVFLEARLPAPDRHRVPVVVDAAGRVLWVPGVVRAAGVAPAHDDDRLTMSIDHARTH